MQKSIETSSLRCDFDRKPGRKKGVISLITLGSFLMVVTAVSCQLVATSTSKNLPGSDTSREANRRIINQKADTARKLMESGDLPQAERLLLECRQSDPKNMVAKYYLAKLYAKESKATLAIPLFDELTKFGSLEDNALWDYAEMCREDNQPEKQERALHLILNGNTAAQRAGITGPLEGKLSNDQMAAVHMEIAEELAGLNRLVEARQHCALAIAEKPTLIEVKWSLAGTCLQVGAMYPEALRLWREIASAPNPNPHRESAKEFLRMEDSKTRRSRFHWPKDTARANISPEELKRIQAEFERMNRNQPYKSNK